MDELLNILNNDDEMNDEQLKKYVEGKSTPEEQWEIEKQIADSDFVNDAVEGLQSLSKKRALDEYVTDLNKQLHAQLQAQKNKKEKRRIKDLPWIILTVIVILLLCIIAYVVITMIK